MKIRDKSIKFVAYNAIINEVYMCNVKSLLARKVKTSVDTISRRMLTNSTFCINDWHIHMDVYIDKLHKGRF